MGVRSRVAIVTGANKGLGLAIVRNLALQYPSSSLHSGRFLVYLTARSAERGAEAVKLLNSDPQLKAANALAQDGGETTIKFQALDINDVASIHEFRDFLKKEHPEGIDIVVNNAGICMDEFNADVVKETLQTNYYGTLAVSQVLLPLIGPGGRLVNVASASGQLKNGLAPYKEAFISASNSSVIACTSLMDEFLADVDSGKEKAEDWDDAAYDFSKAGEIAFTKAMAMEVGKGTKDILVNVCCPGGVKTDMNSWGVKTPDEGARTPVLLALGEFGGIMGGFWRHEKMIEW